MRTIINVIKHGSVQLFSFKGNNIKVKIFVQKVFNAKILKKNYSMRLLQNFENTRFKRFFSKIGFLKLKTVLQEPPRFKFFGNYSGQSQGIAPTYIRIFSSLDIRILLYVRAILYGCPE